MAEDNISKGNGPTLGTYLETRLNLVQRSQEETHVALRAEFAAALAAADLRYQQRFEGQSTALSVQAVLAEKMIQAALAAADRAVSKSEVANDKRFEAIGMDLAQRSNALAEKIDATNKRLDVAEGRANTASGESVGNRRMKDDTRAYIAVGISIVLLGLALATFVIARMQTP